jgi:hypothetical protein
MNVESFLPGSCPCGRVIAYPDSEAGPVSSLPASAEIACSCGRRLDLECAGEGWRLEGVLVREGSVPVTGFSRDLRLAPDAERFWFESVDGLGRKTLVHIVFSLSRGTAEIKQGDAKPLTVSGISHPSQARRHWLARRSVSGGRSLAGTRVVPPRTPDTILRSPRRHERSL